MKNFLFLASLLSLLALSAGCNREEGPVLGPGESIEREEDRSQDAIDESTRYNQGFKKDHIDPMDTGEGTGMGPVDEGM